MKKIFFIFTVFFLFVSSSFATQYTNSEDFLNEEGNICEVATDGCNTIQINNGKLGAATEMYCQDIYGENGQENWSCKKYKEVEDPRICTMEYAPVCAEVQVQCIKAPCYPVLQTFGNKCMAGENTILYTGECDNYVITEMYKKYLRNQEQVQEKLKNIPNKTLEKAIELIDKLVPQIKETKMFEFVKRIRITKYIFLRYMVEKEIRERN